MSFWDNMCAHDAHTAPDAEGRVICATCGHTITVGITRADIFKVGEQIRRAGLHSMQCVETSDGEWCCAPNCPSNRQH